MKRMTVNEIDKFIAKLESTERQDGLAEQNKQKAIISLGILCDVLEDQGKKSMKIRLE